LIGMIDTVSNQSIRYIMWYMMMSCVCFQLEADEWLYMNGERMNGSDEWRQQLASLAVDGGPLATAPHIPQTTLTGSGFMEQVSPNKSAES
jgi:hypothetical protein